MPALTSVARAVRFVVRTPPCVEIGRHVLGRFGLLCASAVVASLIAVPAANVYAEPEGGKVVAGSGTISRPAAGQTRIDQRSGRIAINWSKFNVAAGEVVEFRQPSSSAVALNKIADQTRSEIFGALRANGRVFLINPNGVVFGNTATVKVSSLVATSLDMSVDDFMRGDFRFRAGETPGHIANHGLIEAASGGAVALVGGSVENTGTIVADLGHVVLAVGRKATVDFDGDGLIRFEIDDAVLRNSESVEDAVANTGEVRAAGGQVLLSAKVAQDVFSNAVNTTGVIRAGSIAKQGGRVRLTGLGAPVRIGGTVDVSATGPGSSAAAPSTDDSAPLPAGSVVAYSDVALEHTGTIFANNDAGSGGDVVLESAGRTVVSNGSVFARGHDPANQAPDSLGSRPTTGGNVGVFGAEVGLVGGTTIDASGSSGGGTVLVGGEYQGGGDAPTEPTADVTVVGPHVTIRADALEHGDGGEVVVWADDTTRFRGDISAKGGAAGGDGGLVETSGKRFLESNGTVDASAANGRAGLWLLDPRDVQIRNMADSAGSFDMGTPNTFAPDGTGPAVANLATIQAALEGGTSVEITTASGVGSEGTITLVDALAPVMGGTAATLTLTADVDIVFDAAITATGGSGLSVTANAPGNISLNAAIDTNGGLLSLNSTGGNIALANVENIINAGDVTLTAGTGNITTAGATVDILSTGSVSLSALAIGATNVLGIQGATSLAVSDLGAGAIQIEELTSNTLTSTTLTVGAAAGTIDIAYVGGDILDIDSGHVFQTSSLDHAFSYTATAGSLSQGGALTLGGSASFTASAAGQTIDLTDTGNALGGTLSFSTSGASGNVSLNNGTTATVLGASSIGGALSVTTGAAGGITDAGTISVGNGATFVTDGGNGAIVLTDLALAAGTLDVTTDGSGDVSIVNATAIDLAGSIVGGALSLTATTGGIAQSGPVQVTGTTSLNTLVAGETLLFNQATNALMGAVSVSTVGPSGDAAVSNGLALDLGTSAVGGDLTVTSIGAITQSGPLTVSGMSVLTASTADQSITVGDTGNALTGEVRLTTSGAAGNVVIDNGTTALVLGNSAIGGSLNATSGAAGGIGNATGATVSVGTGATLTTDANNGAISLDGLDLMGGALTLAPNGIGAVSITNANAIDLAAAVIGGSLSVTATTGAITQSGILQVTGLAEFTTVAINQTITLLDSGNALAGEIRFGTAGTAGNVALDNGTTTIDLGTSAVNGALSLTSGGSIGDAAAAVISVANGATVTTDASNSSILLDGLNLTGGALALAPHGSGDAAIVNAGGITLASATIGGNLSVTATTGTVGQTGPLAVTGSSALTTVADNQAISLTDSGNALSGPLQLSTAGTSGDVLINNGTTGIDLGTSSVNGALSLTTAAAAGVTDSGQATVTGGLSVATSANDAPITLDQLSVDGVTLNPDGSGNATVVNAQALDLAGGTIGGDLSVTATTGAITQSGALSVVGAAAFSTLGTDQTITLTQPTNDFQGTVTLNTVTAGAHGGHAQIINGANPLTLGASSIGGDLTVSSGGLTLLGDITAPAQDYSNAGTVTLGTTGVITLDGSAAPGNITFGAQNIVSSVDGANGLSVIVGDNDAITLANAGVGGGVELASLSLLGGASSALSVGAVTTNGSQSYTVGGMGAITVQGTYETTGTGSISFDGNVSLAADTTAMTAGGAGDSISLTGDVVNASGNRSLALNAGSSGGVTLGSSNVNTAGSSGSRLGVLDIDGASVVVNAQVFANTVQLDGNATAGDTLAINGALDAGAISLGSVQPFGSVSLAAVIAATTGAGTLSISSPISLTGPTTLDATTSATFTQSIVMNGNDLAITAPNIGLGGVTLGGGALTLSPVAAGTGIGIHSAASSFNLSEAELQAITGTGTVTIGHAAGVGAVSIGADGPVNLAATTYELTVRGGAATFADTLSGGANSTVTLNVDGVTSSGGTDLIVTGALGSLALTSASDATLSTEISQLAANVTGALDITNDTDLAGLGAVVVTGTSAFNVGTGTLSFTDPATDFQGPVTITGGAGDVTLVDLDTLSLAPVTMTGALEITAAGLTTLGGAVVADGGVAVANAVELGADVTTVGQPITFNGPVTLSDGANVTLSTGTGSGAISLNGDVAGTAAGGAETLQIQAGTGVVSFGGAVGTGTATGLNALTLAPENGDVVIAGPVDITMLTVGNGAFDVALNGDVDVTNAVAFANTGTLALGDGTGPDIQQFANGLTHTAGATELNGTLNSPGAAVTFDGLSVLGTSVIDSAGLSISSALNQAGNDLAITTNGGPVTIGGAATSSGGDLSINAGTGGTALVSLASFSGAAADLTLVQSESTTVTGAVTADALTIQDTVGDVVFGGAVNVQSLSTGNQGFNLGLDGGGSIGGTTVFGHTGGLRLGDDAGDVLSFGNGMDTNTVGPINIAGTLRADTGTLTIGPATLSTAVSLVADELDVTGAITGTDRLTVRQTNAVALVLNGTTQTDGPLDITRAELALLQADSLVLGAPGAGGTIVSPTGTSNLVLDRDIRLRGTNYAVNAGPTTISLGAHTLTLEIGELQGGAADLSFTATSGTLALNNTTTEPTISVSSPAAAIDLPTLLVATDARIIGDQIDLDRTTGTGRLALLPLTNGRDLVLGAGDFLTAGATDLFGFAGELAIGGIVDVDGAPPIEALAGSISVVGDIAVGSGDLTLVSLGDIEVDQAAGGKVSAGNRLTVLALGDGGSLPGNITDTERTSAAFEASEAVFLATGEIGLEANPLTVTAATLSAGAGSGADPEFDVPPGQSAPLSDVGLDDFRDAIAVAVNQVFPGRFVDLSTDFNVETRLGRGPETTLDELGFLDESVFREFTLFAIEVGILVPWYADENFPVTPNVADYLDVNGSLDEDRWREAVELFMADVEAKMEADGTSASRRETIRAEVLELLERRGERVRNRRTSLSADAKSIDVPSLTPGSLVDRPRRSVNPG